MCGLRASRRWIWSSRWTMRRAPFCRRFWARRGPLPRRSGAGGGIWPAWSAAELLYRSGSHYFHTPEAAGRSTARARRKWAAGASGRRTYRGLFAAGAGPVGARLPYVAGPSGEGVLPLPGSPRWRRRTCSCAMSISRPQRAFCGEAVAEGSALSPFPASICARFYAFRKNARSQRQLRSFNRLKTANSESPLRAHFVKATVKVRHYQDGSYAIFHGQRCLGRYDKKGRSRNKTQQKGR